VSQFGRIEPHHGPRYYQQWFEGYQEAERQARRYERDPRHLINPYAPGLAQHAGFEAGIRDLQRD